MVDKPWEEGAIKVIRKAQVPVVPFIFTLEIVGYFIFFQNQWDLPYCKITISFSQKRRVIKVRIGKPISVAEQNEYKTTELYSEFLRKDLHVGQSLR
jgi:1-acyl-sn-glycerol-3-phosphate acyltransferase